MTAICIKNRSPCRCVFTTVATIIAMMYTLVGSTTSQQCRGDVQTNMFLLHDVGLPHPPPLVQVQWRRRPPNFWTSREIVIGMCVLFVALLSILILVLMFSIRAYSTTR